MGHIQLGQESDSDSQVDGRLFLGQTPNQGQRQALVFHCWPR
jgi:hypothetical protein